MQGREEEQAKHHECRAQECRQLLCGTATVADAVLLLRPHLGEAHAGFRGGKDGVVAKAIVAHLLLEDASLNGAFKQMFLALANQGDDRAETGGAVGCVAQFVEQTADVAFGVVALAIAVHGTKAGREHARSPAQCLDLQPRVVGKTVHAIVLRDVASFLQGIALQGVTGFWNVVVATDIGKSLHLVSVGQNLTNLAQLMLVIGGHDEHGFARFHS